MEIEFRTKKLKKELSTEGALTRLHGAKRAKRAKVLKRRMVQLHAAESLADLSPPYTGPARCHELTGDRAGQLSVDLDHPYRLIFETSMEPPPTKPDGGLDWAKVTAITIHGVEDTHG